jgi:REP element-mobilizing transposase RayT
MKQTAMKFRTWGGARKGAGRKPNGTRAGVSHLRRPAVAARFPLHVTIRMRKGVWNLRTRRCFTALSRAFYAGANRFGLRLVHYSVQGNHIHLLVEGATRESISRGMQGLNIRIARALNRVMARSGSVLADRYHSRILRTPTEVKRVRAYLLGNAHHHYGLLSPDPFTSHAPVITPHTYLLRRNC